MNIGRGDVVAGRLKSTTDTSDGKRRYPNWRKFFGPDPCPFQRSEGRQALERYLCGLLHEHPNKNCDTIAQIVPGTSEQRLQGLLTCIDWDEQDLNRRQRDHAPNPQ